MFRETRDGAKGRGGGGGGGGLCQKIFLIQGHNFVTQICKDVRAGSGKFEYGLSLFALNPPPLPSQFYREMKLRLCCQRYRSG